MLMRQSTASDRDMTQAANKHPPHRFRLQFYLLALSLRATHPGSWIGHRGSSMGMVNAYRGAFEARLRDTARALALAMDREIGAYRVAMLTLSGSVALDGPEPTIGTFESEARRAAAALGTSLFLLDATSLQRIIDTDASAGEPVNPITTADYRTVVETGQPLVTDLVIGTVVAKPVIGVAVPVKRDGHIRFVLVARLAPSHVGELLQMEGPPGAAFDAVMDTRGAVVGRSLSTSATSAETLLTGSHEAWWDAKPAFFAVGQSRGQISCWASRGWARPPAGQLSPPSHSPPMLRAGAGPWKCSPLAEV